MVAPPASEKVSSLQSIIAKHRAVYKQPLSIINDREDIPLWALRRKTTLSGKGLLEAIIDPQLDPQINITALSISIPSPCDNPLRAV